MSTLDIKTGAHANMPQQPAQTASHALNCDFLPRYEEQLNENLRSFGEPKGEIQAFDRIQGRKKDEKRTKLKKWALVSLPLLLAIVCVILLASLLPLQRHKDALSASPSQAENAQLGLNETLTKTVESVSVISQTALTEIVTITSLSTDASKVTLTEIMTVTASMPESIAAAASSRNELRSSLWQTVKTRADDTTTISTSAEETSPTSNSTTSLEKVEAPSPTTPPPPPSPETSTTSETTESSEHSLAPEATSSDSHLSGFCGLPGTPCL